MVHSDWQERIGYTHEHGDVNGSPIPMLARLKNWFTERFLDGDPSPPPSLRHTGAHRKPPVSAPTKKVPRPTPEIVELDANFEGRIESQGPGKNVLIRNRYLREDTGTHETLKILDDSIVDSGEETGIDPYNTGDFDRSKKWDQRFRK